MAYTRAHNPLSSNNKVHYLIQRALHWLALVAFACLSPTGAHGDPADGFAAATDPQLRDLDSLRDEVARRTSRITDVYAELESHSRVHVNGRAPQQVSELIQRIAVSGTRRFFEGMHVSGAFTGLEDPHGSRMYLSDELFEAYWMRNRIYEYSSAAVTDPTSIKTRINTFIEATGWWPPSDSTPNSLAPQSTLRATLSFEKCRYLGIEEEGGEALVVVEIGAREKLWLNMKYDLPLVRRSPGGTAFASLRRDG